MRDQRNDLSHSSLSGRDCSVTVEVTSHHNDARATPEPLHFCPSILRRHIIIHACHRPSGVPSLLNRQHWPIQRSYQYPARAPRITIHATFVIITIFLLRFWWLTNLECSPCSKHETLAATLPDSRSTASFMYHGWELSQRRCSRDGISTRPDKLGSTCAVAARPCVLPGGRAAHQGSRTNVRFLQGARRHVRPWIWCYYLLPTVALEIATPEVAHCRVFDIVPGLMTMAAGLLTLASLRCSLCIFSLRFLHPVAPRQVRAAHHLGATRGSAPAKRRLHN
ncbi:hypothetical protein BC834DRAFT_102129 [Gloeopeniophorella convolvens]|nr:hypothetical protein BC834DRAFT_102129 [Gloeopeniophorella convolvens]